MSNYKTLEVWKNSMQLVKNVYSAIKEFPKDELYGLTAQIKRAAVSIPANIAEGLGRQTKKDTIHFLHISRGSLYELDTLLNIAFLNGLFPEPKYLELNSQIVKTLQILNGFINYNQKADLK
ncbi:MAG TPA: four helix bundle protein [Ferruginibacter sp.]|nr:four helix bundle protein [Ferruginibacter sp.]